eukprot:TRINITY_DN2549_c0_g1_i3.p1 TRINITY_DN2549_c0_g1~~TRINITY_DN2549_c0_g1_i3.p1  ORF type:complete len:713 (-),score=154.45 TRINITY_DN2549_c0_g1_i3:230-2368(-)
MPKAKVKRKGVVVPLVEDESLVKPKKLCLGVGGDGLGQGEDSCSSPDDEQSTSLTSTSSDLDSIHGAFTTTSPASCSQANTRSPQKYPSKTLLDLPEEIICMLLVKLDLVTICALEQTCKHLQQLLMNARVWRRLVVNKVEYEPGLRRFLPKHLQTNFASRDLDHSSYKRLFAEMTSKVRHIWKSSHTANVTRTPRLFGNLVDHHTLVQIITSGKYFVGFYMNLRIPKEKVKYKDAYVVDIVDIYDRATEERVRRLNVTTKPDTFRIIDEIKLFLVSYPNVLAVQLVSLDSEESEYIDLLRPGEVESGTVCDIVVREHLCFRGISHRWVVMVAMNTEPIENNQFHIGEIQFYSLTRQGRPSASPLTRLQFHPVPHSEGRFFNQCIQKKGLSDFNEDYAVVVVGGCEGSAVLGVVSIERNKPIHKLQLKGPGSADREGGCEGFCQFSVISLMIDRTYSHMCTILLSTGQLIVIHLPSGNTIFHRHLNYDNQLKLALLQPGFTGEQILAIKFRNFVSFYKLQIRRRGKNLLIELSSLRTITSVDADGRETKCDENPTEELRRQFGELQKSLRALNHYTSGIQKKLDKGLRPGTVTQGVMSMTKKVQFVTSKLDQAHDKAKEIESVVIDGIAFDNRYCHALTLTRDLVTFDLAGSIENCDLNGGNGTTATDSGNSGAPTPGSSSGGGKSGGSGGSSSSKSKLLATAKLNLSLLEK